MKRSRTQYFPFPTTDANENPGTPRRAAPVAGGEAPDHEWELLVDVLPPPVARSAVEALPSAVVAAGQEGEGDE